jgi:hypothetical protein
MEHASPGTIPFEFEVIEVHEDYLQVGGNVSVGEWLDNTIEGHLERGQRIGKLTLDLSQHFAAHQGSTADPKARPTKAR